MENKKGYEIIQKINKELRTESFLERNKMLKKDFTRKRKLPFVTLIYFFIYNLKRSIQKELVSIMDKIHSGTITKSAFCQQRLKLKPEVFIELNEILTTEFYTDNEIEKHLNYRLLSIDGSTIELPSSPEIIEKYGVNNKIPLAKISVIYDILNNITLDGKISHYNSSEYAMAIDLIKKAKEGDLLVLDRGYSATWLFYFLKDLKIETVIRLSRKFGDGIDSFWESKEDDLILEINQLPEKSDLRVKELNLKFKPFKIRLVKFKLKTGEIEVLATSILDKNKLMIEDIKNIYSLRWGIEENYKHLKNHLEMANFTGYSPLIIKQDFYANLFIANIQALIIRDAQQELDEKKKDLKYKYKINRNLSASFMKEKIIEILYNNENAYDELKKLFLIEPIPIREGRSFERKKQRHKKKYYMNQRRGL